MSLPRQERHDTDVDAFVLAGGRSSRMGQDKALVRLVGVPLIQHALGILQAAGLNPRIAGAGSEVSSFAPVIEDDPEQAGLGPLSGICCALSATEAHYSVFLPVDLPLIPPSLVSYLIHHAKITESAATVVSVAGFIQTFPAVIDRRSVSGLRASLKSNDRKSLTAFQTAARHAAGRFSVLPLEYLLQTGQVGHYGNLLPSRWFLNINTTQDLASAESHLTGSHRVS